MDENTYNLIRFALAGAVVLGLCFLSPEQSATALSAFIGGVLLPTSKLLERFTN